MKLHLLVIAAAFLCLISATLTNALFYTRTAEARLEQIFLSYSAKRFIAQSFKNACRGKGFKSLDQWQLVCKSLFPLEQITYEKAGSYNNLIYARWKGSEKIEKCSGEVYLIIEEEGSL